MALSTFVVISRISNLSDARYCAGMGADVLGFVLEPGQPGALTKLEFSDITGWVAGVQFMGEFTSENPLKINLTAAEFGLDMVQLNQLLPPGEVEKITMPVILRVPFSDEEPLIDRLAPYQKGVAYFLIDLEGKTTFSDREKANLKVASSAYPLLLSSGITAANVQEILLEIMPAGICLQGGQELKPGLRDFNELADILELLEQEEA